MYLDLLKSPDDAVRVVRESGSIEGAKMVARYTQTHSQCTYYIYMCSSIRETINC